MGLAGTGRSLDITDIRRPGIRDCLLLRLRKGQGNQGDDLFVDGPPHRLIADQLFGSLLDRGGEQLGQHGILDPFAAVLALGLFNQLGQRLIGGDLRGADGDKEILAVDRLAVGRTREFLQLTGHRTGSFAETELGQHRNLGGQDTVDGLHQSYRIARKAVSRNCFDIGFGFGDRTEQFLREQNVMLRRSGAIRHVVSSRYQEGEQIVVDEGVLMFEFEVGRGIPFRVQVNRHDDEGACQFAAPSLDGHLTSDQTVAYVDALVLIDIDLQSGLCQPGIPGKAGIKSRA